MHIFDSIKRRVFGQAIHAANETGDDQATATTDATTPPEDNLPEHTEISRKPPEVWTPDNVADFSRQALQEYPSAEAYVVSPEDVTNIVHTLEPVDWASIETIARLTHLSQAAVAFHLYHLSQQGRVQIDTRRIPPEIRTVAWLTDGERALRETG